MGALSGDAVMDQTNPYYHSGYMLVTRNDARLTAHFARRPGVGPTSASD